MIKRADEFIPIRIEEHQAKSKHTVTLGKLSEGWFSIGHVQHIGDTNIGLSTDSKHLVLMRVLIYALQYDFAIWLDLMIRVNGEAERFTTYIRLPSDSM
ncbi:hypothetical protein FZC66_19700 [Priestia megaterium]|nr:hypothetical protein FZC66_19700 [Priestia megaterium]